MSNECSCFPQAVFNIINQINFNMLLYSLTLVGSIWQMSQSTLSTSCLLSCVQNVKETQRQRQILGGYFCEAAELRPK